MIIYPTAMNLVLTLLTKDDIFNRHIGIWRTSWKYYAGLSTISIAKDLKEKLQALKQHPRESYNDVIERLVTSDQRAGRSPRGYQAPPAPL